jgi:hypothetical protein
MSLFFRTQQIINETAQLLLEANNRVNQAIADITAVPTLYTANRLTEDITFMAVRWLRLSLVLGRPLGDPYLPTIALTRPAGAIAGIAGIVMAGSLTQPIPIGINPVVTNLVFLGHPDVGIPWPAGVDHTTIVPIRMANRPPGAPPTPRFADALRQQIEVELDHPAAAGAPQRGLYQGYVLANTVPIAIVTLNVI